MTPARCEIMWEDPTSRFHQLWGAKGWQLRTQAGAACWGGDGEGFFDRAWRGTFGGDTCETRNWYTGNEGKLGDRRGGGPAGKSSPHQFTKPAPALLGFD